MANVFEPIIVKITDTTSGPDSDGTPGRKKDTFGAGLAGVAAAIGGIAVLVGEIVSIVKNAVEGVLKPVKTVITGILKLVAQLLRPVVDMLMMVLMPILMFLKPIIRVANEIMRPFRTLAYSLMRQSSQESDPVKSSALNMLAGTTIMAGVGNVLLGMLGEVFKTLISVMASLMRPIIRFVGGNVEQIVGNANNAIDNALQSVQAVTLNGLLQMAGAIHGKTAEGLSKTEELLVGVIGSANENVGNKIKEMTFYNEITSLATNLTSAETTLSTATTNSVDAITVGFKGVGDALVSGIKEIISRAKRAADRESVSEGTVKWQNSLFGNITTQNVGDPALRIKI